MRSVLFSLLLCVFSCLLLVMAATCFDPPGGHCDFTLRMNELDCVKMRINPYDVWCEKIHIPPYYSSMHAGIQPEGCTEMVNAYAPWEYVYMLPFAYLPRACAWPAYCVLMAVALLVLLYFSGLWKSKDASLCSIISFVVVSYTIWSNVSIGNFMVIVLAAAVSLAWALNHGHTKLASVCLAIAMVKPQIGLIFVVPLLMRHMWVTCIGAGCICLLASVVAAILCNSSLFDMLFQGPSANTGCFEGCGTWPKFLCGVFGVNTDIMIGTFIGFIICVVMTWLVRKEKDWFVLLMPAAITSCCWTYTQAYSHAMGWFVAFVLFRELLDCPHDRILWILAGFAALLLPRWILAWHGLCVFCGWNIPLSEYAFRCFDSFNSTMSLVLAVVLCLWLRMKTKELV